MLLLSPLILCLDQPPVPHLHMVSRLCPLIRLVSCHPGLLASVCASSGNDSARDCPGSGAWCLHPCACSAGLIQQAADIAGVGAHNKTSEAQHVDILDHSKQRGLCDLSPSSFDADLAFSMLA